MADQLYTSRHRITYITRDARSGVIHKSMLCDFASLLTAPVDYSGESAIDTYEVVGSPWIRQRGRGNASVSLTLGVATIHASRLDAERYGEELPLYFLTHAIGTLLVEASPDSGGAPRLERRWQAACGKAYVLPMTLDDYYGVRLNSAGLPCAAWRTVEYEFTLTDPDPAPTPYPPTLL